MCPFPAAVKFLPENGKKAGRGDAVLGAGLGADAEARLKK